MASSIDCCTNRMNVWLRKKLVTYGEMKNVRKKRALIARTVLTDAQEKEIRDYYTENYGKPVSTVWHRLYQSYTGCYHKDYFPEILFTAELEPKMNPYREAEFLADKNLLDSLFSDIEGLHIPQTYLSCVRGVLRNGVKEIISLDEAVRILRGLNGFVIKKTRDTNSGRDVAIHTQAENAEQLLKSFGQDFVVQEKIQQAEALAELYPTALNTFRVITYLLDGTVWVCPVAMRLGKGGADRDNMHYGGISIGIDVENGMLKEKAFSEYGDEFTEHPDTHVRFKNYKIPGGGVRWSLWQSGCIAGYRIWRSWAGI